MRFVFTRKLRPRVGLGVLCGLLVLVPALIGAELITRAYEQRSIEDVRNRVSSGLDAVATQADQERTRTLNNAEVAAARLGPTLPSASSDDLLRGVAETRVNVLRSASLLAIVDAGGHTLASDPASNIQFANQSDVKTALQGKIAVGWQERTPLALEGVAPLAAGQGAAVVAENADDTFMNVASRLAGMDMALVQNGRIVSASREIRRSLSLATDTNADPQVLGQPGDTFVRSHFGPDAYFVAARGITLTSGREIGTLLVAQPTEALDAAVRQTRLMAYAAALIGALGAGIVGAALSARLRRRYQREGTARANHLEAVLSSLNEGVIVADAQKRVTLLNPAARALLNVPREDPPLALLAEELVPSSQRVIHSYSAPVREDGSVVTVLRDTTRDQEVERLKSEFLAVVSHELQTPLTAIKGALELVLDDDTGHLSRVQRRFLDTIERNCARLVGLVGDLLDLSRLEAGRMELDPQPLDTPGLVRGALAAVGNLFEARSTEVRVLVPDDLPPIYGDRRRVEQILTNLLANAAKYTPEGGAVDVTGWTENGHVALAVADNGPGVAAAERDIVFDKFYRGRDAQRRGAAGSGLGLAIVKSLVELHGGSIRLDDATLRGARFVVELPRAQGDVD